MVGAGWDAVQIEETIAEPGSGGIQFRAKVRLGELVPNAVTVQVYADPLDLSGRAAAPDVTPLRPEGGEDGARWYTGRVRTRRPVSDFTIRALPSHPNARQPLDLPRVRWER